jgi:2'-5' RNA ligase
LHITLSFLGEIASARQSAVEVIIEQSVSTTPEFEASFEGLGAFPGIRRPEVVWTGMTRGAEQLALLAGYLKENFSKDGFFQDERIWKAHMTLARRRPGASSRGFLDFLKKNQAVTLGSFRVSSVSLMESKLSSAGPSYRILKTFPLRGP